jgi:hypothetical protein
MAELIAIAKALKIPVSKGDVNGSAVCVCVCVWNQTPLMP